MIYSLDTSTIVKSDVEHNNNNKLSVEELIRSDRVLSVRLTGNVQNSSDETSILKRPFSSPPRSQSSHSITEDSGIVVESADTTTPPAFTDTYLMTIPSADDNLDEGGVESQSSIFETRQRTRSMKLVSIPLERINLEWLTEDTKYCPAVIEINDYRRFAYY